MTSRTWWLVGALLGVAFVVLNVGTLLFVDGGGLVDLVGIALGAVMAIVAFGRYVGWTGERA
jgi:uncharacterized membrane protein YedE/YeeE